MLEQLERDKMERLGKNYVPPAQKAAEAKAKIDPIDQVKHGLKTVRTLYTEDR